MHAGSGKRASDNSSAMSWAWLRRGLQRAAHELQCTLLEVVPLPLRFNARS